MAFENAFDRLLEVISEEGYSDGGKCLCSKSRVKPSCVRWILLHFTVNSEFEPTPTYIDVFLKGDSVNKTKNKIKEGEKQM